MENYFRISKNRALYSWHMVWNLQTTPKRVFEAVRIRNGITFEQWFDNKWPFHRNQIWAVYLRHTSSCDD